MPKSRTCGRPPTSGSQVSRQSSLRPAESASPSLVPYSGSRPAARGVPHRRAQHRRDRRRRADRGASSSFDLDDIDAAFEELDARYLAGEAAAHAHTWSVIARARAALNRHELPRDDTGLGEHRPPTRDRFRAWRPDRLLPRRVGSRARLQHLHRGCASAERSRSGLHPGRSRNLARGLRRRVADRRLLTVEGDLISRAKSSTRQTSTPRSRGSTNSAGRRRGWKTRQAESYERF